MGGWSPKFRVHTVTLNGLPVIGFASAETGRVLVTAIDDMERLQLELTLELLPGGLMRSRVKLTNVHRSTYALEDLSLSFPIPPAEATELLDFAGSHNFERVPQRGTLRTGTHLRENRKGRTGSDSASSCTRELLDSDSATAKSGPSTRPGAATTTTSQNASSAIN